MLKYLESPNDFNSTVTSFHSRDFTYIFWHNTYYTLC